MRTAIRSLLVALALAGSVASAAEPAVLDAMAAEDVRRDVLRYHIERGATIEQACEVVKRYFGGLCLHAGDHRAQVSDAPGTAARFYALIDLTTP
jgi:hypothetical protein